MLISAISSLSPLPKKARDISRLELLDIKLTHIEFNEAKKIGAPSFDSTPTLLTLLAFTASKCLSLTFRK
mgnify:CR=1 FL=1